MFMLMIKRLKAILLVGTHFDLILILYHHISSAVFIDIPEVVPHYDFVQLSTYDFQTPDRNPYEADYPSPIYDLNERIPESNVNYQVNYWLSSNVPPSKLHVCIPAFGRTWKLEEDSTSTGVPPIREVSLTKTS